MMNFRGQMGVRWVGGERLAEELICIYAQPLDTENSVVKTWDGRVWDGEKQKNKQTNNKQRGHLQYS